MLNDEVAERERRARWDAWVNKRPPSKAMWWLALVLVVVVVAAIVVAAGRGLGEIASH